mmetsp:Transcript_65938/g.182257  ORF Transcript_65938/g.182257 Transcript_65938/m.182257 type:complete len:213 (+) Transcript_65938:504-1142(+)
MSRASGEVRNVPIAPRTTIPSCGVPICSMIMVTIHCPPALVKLTDHISGVALGGRAKTCWSTTRRSVVVGIRKVNDETSAIHFSVDLSFMAASLRCHTASSAARCCSGVMAAKAASSDASSASNAVLTSSGDMPRAYISSTFSAMERLGGAPSSAAPFFFPFFFFGILCRYCTTTFKGCAEPTPQPSPLPTPQPSPLPTPSRRQCVSAVSAL